MGMKPTQRLPVAAKQMTMAPMRGFRIASAPMVAKPIIAEIETTFPLREIRPSSTTCLTASPKRLCETIRA